MPAKFDPIDLTEIGTTTPCCEESEGGLRLFISDPRVVELPDGGCITFKFKRGQVTIREATKNSPSTAEVDLTLTEICQVEAVEESNDHDVDNGEQPGDALDKLFASLRGNQRVEVEREADEGEEED